MSGRFRNIFLTGAVMSLALIAIVGVHSQTKSPSRKVSEPVQGDKDWPLFGGDATNERYSALDSINSSNVKDLGGAWVSKPFMEGGTSRVSPTIKDGMIFVTAGSRVYAINAITGESLWNFQTDSRPTPTGLDPVLLSGHGVPNTQGVAVAEGKVFVGLSDGHVLAINEKTGEEEWRQQIGYNEPRRGQSVSGAPTYSNGVVFAGIANGDFGLRGKIAALDAKTGHELWHFFVIPAPGEPGSDTWPTGNDVYKIGGGGVWLTGTVDTDLGLVFFGTGNPVPQYAGGARPGDNLYTCSVLALDIKTGKLKWYYQLVHHDIFEADVATPLVLFNSQFGGQSRKAVGAMRPDGYLFVLDRTTGKPIVPVEERPVPQSVSQKTSPTQPFPVGADSFFPDCDWWKDKVPAGFVLGCQFTPPSMPPPSSETPNIMATGFGVRVTPMSYSPQTGYFYVQGTASLGWRRRTDDDFYLLLGGSHVPGIKGVGIFAAIDSKTDKVVWKKEVPSGRLGPLSTAGGLVFRLVGDGNFNAYDAKTGDVLWQFQTGSAAGGLPVSYEIDGTQYIAVPVESTVQAFKLGGALKPLPAPKAPTYEAYTGPIEDTDRIEAVSLFHNNGNLGNRYFVDEYSFNPYRARVSVGSSVTFTNNGKISHTFVAMDGSWTTGTLFPSEAATIKFDKPGIYNFICKEHPWSYGQLIVVANAAQSASGDGQTGRRAPMAQNSAGDVTEQANLGKEEFAKNCSTCHGDDLTGRDPAPALIGDTFVQHWGGRTAGDLFDRIRTTMPQTRPGSLSPQVYLDIVAYLMRTNEISLGKEALTTSPQTLKRSLAK